MRIHEAAAAVGCTQRAIKLYEEKGLLPAIARSSNGYREYTEEDLQLLHEIQAYRKLGIGLSDIKKLLAGDKQEILRSILEEKRRNTEQSQKEIEALEAYLDAPDPSALDEALDFESILASIHAQLPGFFGVYLAAHFAPYLNIRITSETQRDAYKRILAFWDNPNLRLPLLFRIQGRFPVSAALRTDAQIQSMLHPTEEEYARIKANTLKTVRMRENPLVRWSPFEVMKRSTMKKLRNCGYYDIFIPQMKRLSPDYRAYHDALDALDERLCDDLGLYYDSDFNLRLRK